MTPEKFLKEFNTFINAPNGIQQLRNLIIDLAIQGSLTNRGSDISNVNELVELARTRRKEYLRENKVKEPKTPTVIEKPLLDIPEQWAWVQVNELGIVGPKNTIPEDNLSVGFVPMRNVSSSWKETATYEERTWSEIKKGYTHLANGDIAVAKITPCFQNKKSTVVKGLPNGIGAGTTELHVIRPIIGVIIPEYLLTVFKSDYFVKGGVPKMTGTAGQKRIPRDYFSGFVVPLPPLEEQERIVARVDELMELCDQLEEEQQSAKAFGDELRVSTFHHMVQSEKPKDKQNALQILIEESALLLKKPKDVKDLRNMIFDLAVEGKLLNESYKFSEYSDNVDTDNENFFRIPESWEWVPAVDIGQFIRGVTYKKSVTQDTPKDGFMPVLRANNIGHIMNYDNLVYIPDGNIKDNQILKRGDWLICTASGSKRLVGKNAAFKGSELMTFGAFNCAYRLNEPDLYPFIKVFFKSRIYRGFVFDEGTGMTINNLKISSLKKIQFPIPSLEEQERIVARVDELMELCDQLETKLASQVELADEYVTASAHALVG